MITIIMIIIFVVSFLNAVVVVIVIVVFFASVFPFCLIFCVFVQCWFTCITVAILRQSSVYIYFLPIDSALIYACVAQ